jgi:hypothetical protein
MVVDAALIWTPALLLYNAAEEPSLFRSFEVAKAWVYADGRVFASVPAQVHFDCAAAGAHLTRPADPGLAQRYGHRWPRGVVGPQASGRSTCCSHVIGCHPTSLEKRGFTQCVE